MVICADVHRDGLVFPLYLYGNDHRALRRPGASGATASSEIETEDLGLMAADTGQQCWGMPHLEVRQASD